MTYKEFDEQMLRIREYYNHGCLPRTKLWYKFLEPLSDDRFRQVVTFYLLTHNEIPNSPTDLMESHHLLEHAEQALYNEYVPPTRL